MLVGDLASTPLQIGKCVLVGIVLGLAAGVILPAGSRARRPAH